MIMALIEPMKKGGPYTILEQLERKMQVFHLHYEEKKSALKIAEFLNVNRNTVNDDIKFWYRQLDVEPNGIDITAKMIDQVHRMERQRNRLEDYLEKSQTFEEIIKLEKQISEADIRLIQFFSKAFFNGNERLGSPIDIEYISEKEIKNLVRLMIISDSSSEGNYFFTEKRLKIHIISETKCDDEYAERIVEKMKKDGLCLYEKLNYPLKKDANQAIIPEYAMAQFAYMRGYITTEEMKATGSTNPLES